MTRQRVIVALAVAVMLGVAAIAVGTAPDSVRITEPFYSHGTLGESVNTRLLKVEVNEVTLASEINVDYGGTIEEPETTYRSEGVWVTIDVTATTTTDSLILAGSTLTVGELSFGVFALPTPTIESFVVGSDVPVDGTLVFEIPTAVYESATDASVTLTGNFSTPLEQIAVVDVPLHQLPIEDSVTIERAVVSGVTR